MEEPLTLTLEGLLPDLLLHIFSFLESWELDRSVSPLCKSFHHLARMDALWKDYYHRVVRSLKYATVIQHPPNKGKWRMFFLRPHDLQYVQSHKLGTLRMSKNMIKR
jgi:hypothetical protein